MAVKIANLSPAGIGLLAPRELEVRQNQVLELLIDEVPGVVRIRVRWAGGAREDEWHRIGAEVLTLEPEIAGALDRLVGSYGIRGITAK